MDLLMDESPAVKALGSLFKLTEVQLWDDGSSEVREMTYSQETIKLVNGEKDYEESGYTQISGFCSLPEDVELAKTLSDLGLPLSFHTNKETRYGTSCGKRKGARKNSHQQIEIDEYLVDSFQVNKAESESPDSLHDTSKILDQSEIMKTRVVADIDRLSILNLQRENSAASTACTSTLTNEDDFNNTSNEADFRNEIKEDQSNDMDMELVEEPDYAGFSEFSEKVKSGIMECHQLASNGKWVAYWDDYFMRAYFYNIETEESTWDPPSGMEHLEYADPTTDTVDGMLEKVNDQSCFRNSDEVQESCVVQSDLYWAGEEFRNEGNWSVNKQLDEIADSWPSNDNVSSSNITKRKKKVRRTKSNRKLSISSEDLQGVAQDVPASVSKYWCQRYLLFSRFDCGIKMDEEGWFSVTPETLAKHHAVRCGNGAIVDFFTGVGGNAIQFAQRSKHVIAIDVDPAKIDYARHNAAIYGVDNNIDFMKGDSFSLAPRLKANTVFMSPPWGGPAYSKVKKFDMNTMLRPRDGQFLFNVGKEIAPKIVMFLPRNVDINQLAELSLSASPPWFLEVERNFLNGRLKAITAYFSEPSIS